MTDLRYPIGKFEEQPFSTEQKKKWLADIKFLPQELENAVLNLDEAQLNTPYRDGGWKVKQVVHHVADSHMNAFIRFKLGLTEDNPTIKPYDENEWVKFEDVENLPVNVSLTILHPLHLRMYTFLQHVTDEQWQRTIFHPEHQKQMTLWYLLGNYAWHGRHHTAHITSLRERNKW